MRLAAICAAILTLAAGGALAQETITRVSTALDGGGRMAGASRTSATKIE
jgi:hypothetical protein